MTAAAARERLAAWVLKRPPRWPLAEAALLLSVDDYAGLDFAPYLEYLEQLAGRVRQRLAGSDPPAAAGIAALTETIFHEEGFRGNTDDYYDPRNSHLNEVIDRRIGLPITLSVVVIEVARRSGLPVSGIGFPMHFMVRYEEEPEAHILDPFQQGRELSREELLHQWAATREAPWDPEALDTLPDDRILVRILNNMKMVYARRRDYGRTIAAVEKLLLLEPSQPAHHRDLGYLQAANRAMGSAIASLETYLKLAPKADDTGQVRQHLRAIAASIARWN
jgi:regulator of sirC expression with transglutaminase-like and TPR domain